MEIVLTIVTLLIVFVIISLVPFFIKIILSIIPFLIIVYFIYRLVGDSSKKPRSNYSNQNQRTYNNQNQRTYSNQQPNRKPNDNVVDVEFTVRESKDDE